MGSWSELLEEEDAADVVEYGLLIASLAVLVLLATLAFGQQLEHWFEMLTERLTRYS